MKEEEARELICSTFENLFDENNFKKFVFEMLKDVNDSESKRFSYSGQYIPENFKDHISSYKRIGQYETDKKEIVDILIVSLKNENKLERARSTQRNFIRWYLNGGRGEKFRDSALVAFISKDSENWRFSFVKMQYDFTNGKIQDILTPAKRYSFIVGKNESSHTAQTRFLQLLTSDQKPSLSEIEEAFNVERVTDEFFNEYKALFIKTVDEIEKIKETTPVVRNEFNSKNISTVDFAKKLLGQIVFIYFLQKKGWLGVEKNQSWGSGSRQFLRNLFEKSKAEGKNFFDNYLKYLFYEALNNERSNQADPSYYAYLDCKIPFLNGGLFEPYKDYDWKNINLLIPNELFSNQSKDGILDVFDLFNFTVKEDEPLEKEVAIDPELLGKIYEKLNAIREDNFEEYKKAVKSDESKFNKSYGVYYTPREIVHFMAQNVLVEYLFENLKDKSQDLEGLKRDLENFIFHSDEFKENDAKALEKQEKIERGEQKSSKYKPKISAFIQENAKIIDKLLEDVKIIDPAVGSGAFPIGLMHEIIKAREYLHNLYFENKANVYELKSHCIQNSLYGVDIDSGAIEITRLRFWLSLVVDEEDLTHIRPLPNLDYKLVVGDSLSHGISIGKYIIKSLERLDYLTDKYPTVTNFEEKKKLKQEIDHIINELTGGQKEFDYYVYFSKIMRSGGFDIVIGNPPYIQLQKNHGKLANLYKRFQYEVFDRMGDIYTLFYEKGIKILKDGGHLCFITSNKWMRAGYGEKLREFFSKYNPKILIDLGPGVFESATVDTNILLIQKSSNKNLLKAVSLKKEEKENINIALDKSGVVLSKLSKDPWFIGSDAEQKLKEKIESIGKPLKDWDVKIYRGVLTGLNEAFIITTEKRNEILANCKDEEERERTKAIIKPILRGRDIKRYYYEWAGLWVIGIFPALRLNIEDYTALKKYFLDNFDIRQLEQSGKQYPELGFSARKKTGNKWFETQDQIAYYPDFEKEKVVYSEIVRQPQFYFDKNGFFVEATSFLMTGKNVKYICGLLDSKPVTFFFKTYYAGGGLGDEGYRYKKAFLENLPIPPITSSNEPIVNQIETLVDKIIETKQQDPKADTNQWEREIDELVYKLYDLTKEEIKIIEGKK